VFWNSVFTSFVEHVLMKLGEALLGRRRRSNAKREAVTDGTAREIRARRTMRTRLATRGPSYYVLLAVTMLMDLDLLLFGGLPSGSYCLLVEKPHHER
jgi:hypothetical protein